MSDEEQALDEAGHLEWLAGLKPDEGPDLGACEAAVPTADKSWLECGQDAVAVYDYRCHEGHVKRRATCTEHEPVLGAVGCRECWETAGADRPMTFTKIAGPGRTITEDEYRAWLEWRQPRLAAELTELLPQEVRDAGLRVEWAPGPPVLAPDGIETFDMVLPKWPDCTAWTPKCYRLASGAAVHVKPGCRCPLAPAQIVTWMTPGLRARSAGVTSHGAALPHSQSKGGTAAEPHSAAIWEQSSR